MPETAVPLTEREVFNYGNLKAETGKFVVPASGNFSVHTKLRRILFFFPEIMEDDGGAGGDSDVTIQYNSDTVGATTQDDGGVMACTFADFTAAEKWTYIAIGK
jgi:hypothetical protein